VPFAPEHTMYADALYRQPLKHSFWRAVYVGVSTLGAGKIYWDEANSFSQPFYALLNARAGLELSKYANLEVRGQNLTGTRYATFSFNSMSNRFEQRGAPRYFEFALRLKF
ncbi:MAG: TonB-dependent receptor, partial [Alloprevotella sp.]|nr:TonB-dependent receptor [Alloprevotella sp.]